MNRTAILTFDYEVFLGKKTGTIENCVLRPTEMILDILLENNAKAIFFVDTTWLLFLKEYLPEDFFAVSNQLKKIVSAGSSVELHLHPQWKDAYLHEGTIKFKTFSHYSLKTLSNEEIISLFKKSVELLENITAQKVNCFRAGGFCIEPFNKIKDALNEVGIKYDFSVAPKVFLKSGQQYDFDFSDVPIVPVYKFRDDVKKPDPSGEFVELPLSVYNNNPIYRLVNKIALKLKKDRSMGDGVGIRYQNFYFFRSFSRRLQISKEIISLDSTYNRSFRFIVNNHFKRSSLITIISHPKMMSKEGLNNLRYVSEKFQTIGSNDIQEVLTHNVSNYESTR
ncbi:MAG: hypothetical protein EOO46_17045 [Flavobacterium sp.]|nr:MAG: hypothetical protein EOO46_17045 [Flavobacterium sp.]